MVYLMENPIKMDDLVGFHPYFWKHPFLSISQIRSSDLPPKRGMDCIVEFWLALERKIPQQISTRFKLYTIKCFFWKKKGTIQNKHSIDSLKITRVLLIQQ